MVTPLLCPKQLAVEYAKMAGSNSLRIIHLVHKLRRVLSLLSVSSLA